MFFSRSANQLFILFFVYRRPPLLSYATLRNTTQCFFILLFVSYVQIFSPSHFSFKEASVTVHRRPTSLCCAYAIWITYFFPSVLYTFISLAFFGGGGIYFLRTTLVERRLLMFALSHGFQYLQNMNSQWLATIQQIWLHQIEEQRILRFWGFKMESRIIKF